MKFRVLITDDEPPARAKLRRLLASDERFCVVGEARDGVEAVEAIRELGPDLVFLDIRMPGLGGFEVLAALGECADIGVIFSTAHEEHAVRAFDVRALDYLLKPYDGARFRSALDRAAEHLGRMKASSGAEGRLVFKMEDGWHALPMQSVSRVSAAGKEVLLSTTEGVLRVRQSLTAVASKLDDARFVRVHRSEIVRVDAVVRYEPIARGDGLLTLVDGSAVVLSRTQRQEFFRRFRRA